MRMSSTFTREGIQSEYVEGIQSEFLSIRFVFIGNPVDQVFLTTSAICVGLVTTANGALSALTGQKQVRAASSPKAQVVRSKQMYK